VTWCAREHPFSARKYYCTRVLIHFVLLVVSAKMVPKLHTNGAGIRPVVVLAGWLGSKPYLLKRYVRLYENCGFDTVLVKIATPSMIINSILHPNLIIDKNFPPPSWDFAINRSSIKSLAWDVIRDLVKSNCSFIIFHSFSNGGFFLWENMRQILLDDTNSQRNCCERNESRSIALSKISEKLGGLVFDSCPGIDMSLLPKAMEHASLWERFEVIQLCGLDYLLLNYNSNKMKQAQEIAHSYLNNLQESHPSIPHLFLYSRNDPLAPCSAIDEVVQYRVNKFGQANTFAKRWEDSIHCGHILSNPDDYREAVDSFVTYCVHKSNHFSKL
jgi:Eukaryotic protein of unknown function (DUF829)